jgi:enoyl-CoA hydratase/carnithine racemase
MNEKSPPFSTIIFTVDGPIARITLNRPETLNAYNTSMRDELTEALAAVHDDSDLHVLVLDGAGRAFCAGADLTEFGTSPSPTAARELRFARDPWALLETLPVPSIAALHGFTFGSGLEMALFCDLRVAADDVEIAMPEVGWGLMPAAGGSQTLPRTCGLTRALELTLTGRRIRADEARAFGLVFQVVPAAELRVAVDWMARELAGLDPNGVRMARRAVREGLDLPLSEAIQLESRLAKSLRAPGAGLSA